ncbi:NAD(P)-dependent oxidoreductase [Chloroflexus sp.]|uniref:NAD(P)-dependent oxidoreductase n=1 Tax=Chloroflexus sp. TaxID=1904827 RepID=UPI00298EDA33|nr:NAD(P)-dependent oxidoreductase [Chloroflexus sp.]MCS6888846.1 NAD(P)-dependent oxidoreductase [Chloroflexus sp.]MCX7860255.1 NAD(P)-dependent oxidoreductase [Chloroflexus sp.]MDW8404234.1 NAD(P)-dependent oxidoreductase [Chloroflexus sp.]
MTIALLGLGLMGRPMARTLLAAGWPVVGWNRSPLDPELTAGIPLAATLAEAAQAETLILMLSDSAAVDDLLARLDPLLQPGQLVIDMGSSDPLRSQAHATALAARGVGWVDAPVSGGPEGAAAGTLAIMVGGTETDVARAMPLLSALGRPTHVGPPGAGHTAKVINQLIVGLTIQAVAEATVLAEAYGLDPALLRAALAGGFADSKVLQIHGARMAARRYIPGGKVTTQLKDLRMAAAMAAAAGIDLPHLRDTITRYETLVARGHGDLDHSALHMLLAGDNAPAASLNR